MSIVVTAAISMLLSRCAPSVGVQTMAGVVQYESGWKPWAIGDNTAHQSYFYGTQADAARAATILATEGHDIDVGLAQINSSNFAAYGLTPASALDPCTNLRAGSIILTRNYVGAMQRNWLGRRIRTSLDMYYQQQLALVHALSAYNSGRYWASMRYAQNVYDVARGVEIAIHSTRGVRQW